MKTVPTLIPQLIEKCGHGKRSVLGIAGPPGSGKSTLAAKLFDQIEAERPGISVVVPMDGFHLDNETLDQMGLLPLKGIPASFDAAGFVQLLQSIREAGLTAEAESVLAPIFNRGQERSIQNGIEIGPQHQLVLVEGNYLLLDDAPWNKVMALCDEVWYIDVPEDVLIPRLVARHMAGGKSQQAAEAKVASTDLPNGRLVARSQHRADRILRFG